MRRTVCCAARNRRVGRDSDIGIPIVQSREKVCIKFSVSKCVCKNRDPPHIALDGSAADIEKIRVGPRRGVDEVGLHI